MNNDEEWMNVEVDASGGDGKAIAAVLEPIVKVARDAPEWAKYDIELKIEETDTRTDNAGKAVSKPADK